MNGTSGFSPSSPVRPVPLPAPGSMGPPVEFLNLRQAHPLVRVRLDPAMPDSTAWYVTRYADVKALMSDPRFIRPSINSWPARGAERAGPEPELITMMELDGARHVALRRAIADAFSARAVRRYAPRSRRIAVDLLDEFARAGQPGDLVPGFAEPFPLLIACDFLGIPYQDRDYFVPLVDTALAEVPTLEEGARITALLRGYVCSLIARKRGARGNDPLTRLVAECDDGELTEEAVISFVLTIFFAGYGPSAMFLANAILTLLAEPAQYRALRDNRQLMRTAVDELLRYIPVMNGVVILLATEDIQLHEEIIRAGDAVLPVLAAADRDETVFSDADTLDLGRAHNPHIVFGRGPHNCLGAHLARAELATALDALLDRFPDLHLATGQKISWDDTSPSRAPLTLPVAW